MAPVAASATPQPLSILPELESMGDIIVAIRDAGRGNQAIQELVAALADIHGDLMASAGLAQRIAYYSEQALQA